MTASFLTTWLGRAALSALVLLLTASSAAAAAEAAKKNYDLPAGDAAATLKQFAEQSGEQVIFLVNKVTGVKTAAVSGELTAHEALERMVAGTELVVVQDEKSGALAVRRAPGPNVPEAAQLTESAARKKVSQGENGTLKLEQVEVTGSRIRTLVGEQTVQPVLSLTAKDIARTGASSLGEMFKYIPQITSSSTGVVAMSSSRIGTLPLVSTSSSRVTATLRGAPAGGTLLLINGRRAPKTGQETSSDAYDLSGIPLSAIERIDVLLDGASAIYGSDAVGGVINIILRKQYAGTTVRLGYENTFDSDVSVKSVSVAHGFSAGKLSGMVTASWEEAHGMMWRDRSFLQTYDRRAYGGTDGRIGFPAGGTGAISTASGLNLPGLTTNRVAIPAGSTGTNVTVAAYGAAGPVSEPYDAANATPYSNPYRRESLMASLEYEVRPWLNLFGDYRWSKNTSWALQLPITAFSDVEIPAGAPGNPFGVPLILEKVFFDQGVTTLVPSVQNQGFTVGARGLLPRDWRYEATLGQTQAKPRINGAVSPYFDSDLVDPAFASARPPVLLYDSTRSSGPNPPGTIQSLLQGTLNYGEAYSTWTYDAKADGPIWSLPAGDLRLAVGAEYREEYVDFPVRDPQFNGGYARASNRYTAGYYAEARVPLLGERQGWFLLNKVEGSVAIRRDSYSDFRSSSNPRYGVLYRPFGWLMARASYGKGYKVPTLASLTGPISTSTATFAGQLDQLRGNQPITGTKAVVNGGNPNLRAERSKSTTAGVVLEVPYIKGLSFAWDWYDTKYLDRVGGIPLTDRTLYFPETITRGPNLPGDLPGWPGPITGVDQRAVNIAFNRVTGYDLTARYNRPTVWGEFTFNAVLSRIYRNESRSLPNSPPNTTTSTFNVPMQANGSLFWSKGALDVGVIATYRGRYRINNVASTPLTASATRWDWQGSYDFDRGRRPGAPVDAWWRRALAHSKIGLTIFNVLDTEPPFYPIGGLPDNNVLDSRMRRYALSLTKQF